MKKKRPRKTAASPKKSSSIKLQSSSKLKNSKSKSSARSARKTPISPRVKGLLSRTRLKTENAPKKITVEPLSYAVKEPSVSQITDLPFSYNQTRLELLVRDPFWAFAFWDFSGDTWNWMVAFREQDHAAQPKLRIHNLNDGTSNDLNVYLEAKNWYLELGHPDCAYEVELGFLDSHGKFHTIARSNRIRSPRNGPSSRIDPEWPLSDFELLAFYGRAGFGADCSSGSSSSFKRRSS